MGRALYFNFFAFALENIYRTQSELNAIIYSSHAYLFIYVFISVRDPARALTTRRRGGGTFRYTHVYVRAFAFRNAAKITSPTLSFRLVIRIATLAFTITIREIIKTLSYYELPRYAPAILSRACDIYSILRLCRIDLPSSSSSSRTRILSSIAGPAAAVQRENGRISATVKPALARAAITRHYVLSTVRTLLSAVR